MSDEEKKHGTMGQNEYEAGQHVKGTQWVINRTIHIDEPVVIEGQPGDTLIAGKDGGLCWGINNNKFKVGDSIPLATVAIGGTYTVHENGKQIGGPIPADLPPGAKLGIPPLYKPWEDLQVESSHVTLSELKAMMDNYDKMKAAYRDKFFNSEQPAAPAAPESDGKRKFKFDRDH